MTILNKLFNYSLRKLWLFIYIIIVLHIIFDSSQRQFIYLAGFKILWTNNNRKLGFNYIYWNKNKFMKIVKMSLYSPSSIFWFDKI